MTLGSPTSSEFDEAWRNSPDHRYGYEMNNAALALFSVLLFAFWTYWGVTVFVSGIDMVLQIVGGLFLVITIYILGNVIKWRHYGRTSGVVCESNQIIWKHGLDIHSCDWKSLDVDVIGLLDVAIGENKYEHYLTIGEQPLYIFRPFVRMRSYERFMADVLLKLKEHGGLSGAKKKKSKGKRK